MRIIYHRYFTHGTAITLGIVIGLSLAIWYFNQSPTTTNQTIINPTISTGSATPAANEISHNVSGKIQTAKDREDELTKYLTVEAALLGVGDKISLYFKDLNLSDEVAIDPTRSWIPASTIKSYLVLEAFRQRDNGAIDFDREVKIKAQNVVSTELETDDYPRLREGTTATIRQLVEAMIVQSDNTAYNTLLDVLDRRNVNLALRNIGLTETVVGEKLNLDDDQTPVDLAVPGRQANTTTAKDLATFFDLLYGHKVADADEILAIFKKQKINNMIPALLPGGTTVAHKTGNWAPIFHDGGVVFKPNAPFILTVFTDGGSPEVVAKLAQVAYFRDPAVVGKESSLNFETPSIYHSIALTETGATKVLGESISKFSEVTSLDFGITSKDLFSKDQSVQSLGSSLVVPGSLFYNLKLAFEGFSVASARTNRQKSEAYLSQAQNRLSEIKTLLASGKIKEVGNTLVEGEKDLEQAAKLAQDSPDRDLLLTRVKGLLDLYYAVLKNKADSFKAQSKKDLVDAVYQFYQKEHQNLAPAVGKVLLSNPIEQAPLTGLVTDVSKDKATIKLSNGSEKEALLTSSTNVRGFQDQNYSGISAIRVGDQVAVVGPVVASGKLASQFILRELPEDLKTKHQGVVTEINADHKTIDIVDTQGQKEVIEVSHETKIRSKDTDVSLEGIKAGSVVTVYGIKAPLPKTSVKTTPSGSASAEKKITPKAIKANSVTVIVNSSGKGEKTTKK